ncbi:lysozyme [Paraburkholderia monticola]|uniref:Lysozyme n=1 Tax=Paraburkholderia monticola TaxID=1399968 RepID=A0A149PVP3_9BURK|nr:lysozyme [Paraburkholderia monticola]KXU89141.1 lysozyme [Paraburkholderia monticola]
MPNANANKTMSEAGYTALRFNEGVVMRYYNDAPQNGNCTWGIGTLAHFGPCTEEELARTVVPEQANAILQTRVRDAEAVVKAVVTKHELTQAQFDAAVSFAYNSSRQNTRDVLNPANRGDMTTVAQKMMLNVMITPRDRTGRKIGPAKISRGLMNRRQRESAPFGQSTQ